MSRSGITISYRNPTPEEMDQVYLMGFDVWGECTDEVSYLQFCRGSKKYERGDWRVLEAEGTLVSSLIIFRGEWGLKPGYMGIGSVCTVPSHRGRGYASALLKRCISELKESGGKGVYLFSDIDPKMYQRLGFNLVKDYESEGMMFLFLSSGLQSIQPSYF